MAKYSFKDLDELCEKLNSLIIERQKCDDILAESLTLSLSRLKCVSSCNGHLTLQFAYYIFEDSGTYTAFQEFELSTLNLTTRLR